MSTLSPLFSWRSQIAKSDLPAPARHIALTLSLFMSEIGTSCWPSITKLCEATGLSRATVCKHLEILEAKGWLGREKGGKGKSTHYTARIPELVRETDYLDPEVVREVDEGSPSAKPELVKDHDKDLNPSPATPSKAERDFVWDALEAVFGKPTTPQHRSRFGRTRNELLADTSLTPAAVVTEIPRRVAAYRSKWPDADLTLEAFAKHWPDLRTNGSRPSANFPSHLLDADEFREWRRTATRDDMVRYQHEFDVDDHGAPLEGF